jgi:hypothetical protein
LAKKLSLELQQALEATLALINTSAYLEDDLLLNKNKESNKLLGPIKDRIKTAQLDNATCKRIIKKINTRERKDHEITLMYATIENGSLFLDNKL